VRLLLDSNAFLWWRLESQRLSGRVAAAIRDPGNDVIVSVASLWEIAIKRSLGKLQFRDDFEEVLQSEDFVLLLIGYDHHGVQIVW
jgi:PIN domain nuclease of toxin-antitoxin system